MTDIQSAYGVRASVVNWTLSATSITFFTSLTAFALLSTSRSFNGNGIWSKVFSQRRHLYPSQTHPEPPNSRWYSWILNVHRVSDVDYMMTSGIDALMATKFHSTMAKICGLCTLYGVLLAYVHNTGKDLTRGTAECHEENLKLNATDRPDCVESDMYSTLTMANVDANSNQVYYDIFGVYLFTVIALYHLWKLWRDYGRFRHVWMARPVAENQSVSVPETCRRRAG